MANPDDRIARLRRTILHLTQKNMRILDDASYAGEPFNEEWSDRRKKVWADAQLSTAMAPIYLKMAADWGEAVMKAESQRPEKADLNLVEGPTLTRDQWQRLAANVEEDTKNARKLIDAQVVEEPKANADG